METLTNWATIGYTWLIALLPMVIKCVIVLVAGAIGIKIVLAIVEKALGKTKADPTAFKFVLSVLKVAIWFLVGIVAISALGFDTTSLITIFGTATLAIGLAVKDNLANFASGVLMIFTRPFKAGDTIKAQGETGVVEEITVLNTRVRLEDGAVVMIPNKAIVNGNITNFSVKD